MKWRKSCVVYKCNLPFHLAADQTEDKPKSEKDTLKDKYPALCQPDAPVWMVRLV